MEANRIGRALRATAAVALFVALAAIATNSGVSASSADEDQVTITVTGSGVAEVGKPYRIDVAVEGIDPRDVVEWTVDWGDGTLDTKKNKPGRINHKYDDAGTNDIVVTVVDDDGNRFVSTNLVVPFYDASRGLGRYDVTTGSLIAEFGESAASLDTAFASTIGPDGLLYVTGNSSNTVERFDMADNSHVDTFVPAGAGGLERPTGLAFGPDGDLYVASSGTAEVARYDGTTGSLVGIFTTSQPLNTPSALAFGPDGDLYVADRSNDSIERYNGATGVHRERFAQLEPGASPSALAFGPNGDLLVALESLGRVDRLDGSGSTRSTFAANGLIAPSGLRFGPDGALWVADYWAEEIKRFDASTGRLLGPGTGDSIAGPRDVTFVPQHTVFVSPVSAAATGRKLSAQEWLTAVPATQRGGGLVFEANDGRAEAHLDYIARGASYDAVLSDGDVVLSNGSDATQIVTMRLIGRAIEPSVRIATNNVAGTGGEAIEYPDVYSGVDVQYATNGSDLEYSFIVEPGVDPSGIRLEFSDVSGLSIAANGDLLIDSAAGADLLSTAPFTYQDIAGSRVAVESAYVIRADGTVGFTVGDHDQTAPLIIDPTFKAVTTTGADGNSITITKPASVSNGDFLIAQIFTDSSGITFTPPAGWTPILETDSGAEGIAQALFYRFAGTSEPSSYVFALSEEVPVAGAIGVFTGVDKTNPIDAAAGRTNSSGNATTPSITTTVANTRLVAFFGVSGQSTLNPPAGMTERWDIDPDPTVAGADQNFAGVGATGTRSANNSSGNKNLAQLVALRPRIYEDLTAGPSLVLSTLGDVNAPSGAPGLDSWSAGGLLEFGDPGFALEPPATGGTFSLLANLDVQGQDGDVVLNGLDLVTAPITIGSSPSVGLQAGDLLLSTKDDETFVNWDASTTVTKKKDIIAFRPRSPGDYTSGTFSVLLADPLGGDSFDFALVGSATTVGDTALPAGSFVLATGKQLLHLDPVAAGLGQFPGVPNLLLDGPDVGIDQNIVGLDVIDDAVQIDGVDLYVGDVVVSVANTDLVGDNDISVLRQDIFRLRLDRASGAATASGQARLVFDGSDVGLDINEEDVTGLAINGGTPLTAPIAVEDGALAMANDPLVIAPLVNDIDPNQDPLSIDSFTQPGNGTVTDNGDGTLTYTPTAGYTGSDGFTYTITDGTETDSANFKFAVRTPELRISTSADVVASGTPGITSWTTGDMLSIGDPGLTLEPGISGGMFGRALDLNAFAADGAVRIDAIHRMTEQVTIGEGGGSFDLEIGDLVFATNDTETMVGTSTSVVVANKDIFVFRPDSPGSPDQGGEFFFLLDDPTGGSIESLTIVEQDTIVGDTVVSAGTILLVHSGQAKTISTYDTTAIGESTTVGTVTALADLGDVGLGGTIDSLDLIERTITVGGRMLTEGTILASTDGSTTVGSNSLPVDRFDLFGLTVTETTLVTGTTAATASMVFDGSEAALDDNTENPTALAIFGVADQSASNTAPVAVDDVAATGVSESVIIDVVANDTDADLDPLTVEAVTNGANGTVVNNGDGTVTYTRDTLFVGVDTFSYRINDGNGATDTAIVTVNADPSTGALAIWAESGSTIPQYSQWDGSAFGPTLSSANVGGWRIIQGAEAPTRDEAIVLGVDSGGVIRGEMWNGSTWNALAFNPMATVSESFWWGFDVEYEGLSGDAVMVWNNGSTGSTGLTYRVWNGLTWTAAQTITTPLSGEPKHLRMVADPHSDNMILVASNSTSQDYAMVWDGSAWGNAITLSSNGSGDDRTDVNATWETLSGDAIVAYGKGTTSAYTRTWDGAGWSGETAITLPSGAAGSVRWTVMASDPNSDRTALGVLTNQSDIWFAVSDGSTWGSKQLATTTANGITFPNVAVAFESTSSDLLAAYAEGDNKIRSRTMPDGGAWSAQQEGTDLGAKLNSMRLYPDPNGDRIMFAANVDNSDLQYVLWDGDAWGTRYEPTTNTGEVKNQPFVFLWDSNQGVSRNAAPTLDPVGAQSVDETVLLSFTATASDTDLPAQTLTFTLEDGTDTVPAGAAITAGGNFTWTPTETQGGTTHSFKIRVTDDGKGTLFDEEEIVFTVNDTNTAPILSPIGDQTIVETVPLTFTLTATDTDAPADTLTYSATGMPTGATLNPTTGAFSWTPTPLQGPGSYPITFTVTDDGTGTLTDSELITVTVSEPNLLVNSTGDASDQTPGDGLCETGGTNSEGAQECTLRAAIEEANAFTEANDITFAIPDTEAGYQNLGAGNSYWSLQPATSLPAVLRDATIIDGTTQGTYAAGQGFFWNAFGPSVELDGSVALGVGLEIAASDTTTRGLVINRFATGIALTAGDSNSIVGNYLGPDVTGAVGAVGNTSEGINIYGATNTIVGGTSVADRNIISGNRQRGVFINDFADGAAPYSDGTQVIGNYIGTDAGGTSALPYDGGGAIQQMGIALWDGPDNTFGGSGLGEGNLISGNSWHGIYIWGPNATNNTAQGNIIGLDAAATTAIGNGSNNPASRSGVLITSAPDNLVGGPNPGEGNIIAGNDAAGAAVTASSGNSFLGNSFFDNDGIGLDLDLDGITANDPLDADAGANDLLNHPEVTGGSETAGTVTVDFDLDVPSGDYRIELFINPSGPDPSGQGEGEVYESATTITHAGSGTEAFQITYLGTGSEYVSLTATEESAGPVFGSTSEYSVAVAAGSVSVNSSGDATDATPGDSVCDTGGVNADGNPECTLRAAIDEANASTIVDTIGFAIPATDPGHSAGIWTISPTSAALPTISRGVIIDGGTQPGYVASPIVQIDGTSAPVSSDGLLITGTGDSTTIAGLSVTNFPDDGIEISISADAVTVADTYIGVEPDGATAGPNGDDGIDDKGATNLLVTRSVISANVGFGVQLRGASAAITDNKIGVASDGVTPLGNGSSGLFVRDGASTVTIGGTGVNDGNVIAHNAAAGILLDSAVPPADVAIIGNSVHDNTDLGIDLDGEGVTPNDPTDADSGSNDLLNFPEIVNVQRIAGDLIVDLDLDVPAGNYRVELFGNTTSDGSGYGEGEMLFGSGPITHGGAGPERFTVTGTSPATIVTATVTEDLGGSFGPTSEFSLAVPSPDLVVVNSTGDGIDAISGDGQCDTGGTNSDGDPECTLRAAIDEVNDAASPVNTVWFSIPATDPNHVAAVWTISPASTLPAIVLPVTIDASTQSGHVANTTSALAGLDGTLAIQLDGSSAGVGDGLSLDANDSTLRGIVVNGFDGNGIELSGDNIMVADLYVGTDVAGTTAVPNTGHGLVVSGNNITLGGSTPADRALVAGNGLQGLEVTGSDLTLQGSIIGLDASATAALPNGRNGVRLNGAVDAIIGTPGNGNVISGNNLAAGTADGVFVSGGSGHLIQANLIGTNQTGDPFGNFNAGVAVASATDITIGGATPPEGNNIAHNGGDGIEITGAASTVSIFGNSTWSNGDLGIDLEGDGPTTNDPGDGDTGPNTVLNTPVLGTATASGGVIALDYTLDVPAGTYRVEFFGNPIGADPSGFGEGQSLLATDTIVHSGSGSQADSVVLAGTVGDIITANATRDLGGGSFGVSSEYSGTVTAAGVALSLVDDYSVRRSDVGAAGGISMVGDNAPGILGRALDFDGANDRLIGPALDITDGELAIGAWIRPDALAGQPRVLSKVNSGGSPITELYVDAGSGEAVVALRIGGSTVTARGGLITTGTWNQLAASWDGAELVLVVDGSEVDRVPAAGSLATDVTTKATIGNNAASSQPFNGLIDQVRLGHVASSVPQAEAQHTNATDPGFVQLGAEQTSTPGAWTTTGTQTRSGSFALSAPDTTGADAAAWAVAAGIDEPGVVFESWWWLSTDTGIDLASGTRAGIAPTDEYEAALLSSSGWELRQRVGMSEATDAAAAGSPSTGAWVKVELWTDQLGDTRLFIDGVEETTWTPQGSALASGSMALRAGLLPSGEDWFVDDARGRKLITPEPLTTLGPLDRN